MFGSDSGYFGPAIMLFFFGGFLIFFAFVLFYFCFRFCGARAVFGDASVFLHKHGFSQNQLTISVGDQFIVDFKLRSSATEAYNDITSFNVTQSVRGVSTSVLVVLTRMEKSVFSVTSVCPVISKHGRDSTVLSKSYCWPVKYMTELSVKNSFGETLPSNHIYLIYISSHHLVTNPGIRMDIYPFS